MNTNNGVLTLNQYRVLEQIIQGHRTCREIAGVLNVGKIREQDRKSPEGIGQTAAALVRKGWVERVRIRGIVHYRSTPAGREKFRKADERRRMAAARRAAEQTRAAVAGHIAERWCRCAIPVHHENESTCLTCDLPIAEGRIGFGCYACMTGYGRHTCGLRRLQDDLSIPVQGRHAGPPRRR